MKVVALNIIRRAQWASQPQETSGRAVPSNNHDRQTDDFMNPFPSFRQGDWRLLNPPQNKSSRHPARVDKVSNEGGVNTQRRGKSTGVRPRWLSGLQGSWIVIPQFSSVRHPGNWGPQSTLAPPTGGMEADCWFIPSEPPVKPFNLVSLAVIVCLGLPVTGKHLRSSGQCWPAGPRVQHREPETGTCALPASFGEGLEVKNRPFQCW